MIPNGVDTVRFGPARTMPLRPAARMALGLGTEVMFLAAAYNLRLKGVDTAIRALARLPENTRLMIAGGTPDAHWRRLTMALGVGDRVRFLGQVDDMAPIFAAADVFVHPTRWDACSLSTIEAGAAARPVITTALNGAAELIENGRTGFVLSDPEDAVALAERMRFLLDADLRRRLGQAALAASAGHDIRLNLRAVETVLTRTADQLSKR